jgi:hypothetical protein
MELCVCVWGGGVILRRYIYPGYTASMAEGVTPYSLVEVELNFQRSTRRHITEDNILHSHAWGNFRSNIDKMANELNRSGRGLIEVLSW